VCYSIPGKVVAISGKTATIDYFGEKRVARSDGVRVKKGDYVYVQGGFIVDKAGKKEAEEALEVWKEAVKKRESLPPATAPAAKKLFFLYAHPCGDVLVAKGKMKASKLAEVRRTLQRGGIPKEPPSIFEKGVERLAITAARIRKPVFDAKTMRQYFWFDHDDTVEDGLNCRILPAKVLKVVGANALVSTPLGLRNVNISMLGKARKGDLMTVHYDYACERISQKDFEQLWKVKK